MKLKNEKANMGSSYWKEIQWYVYSVGFHLVVVGTLLVVSKVKFDDGLVWVSEPEQTEMMEMEEGGGGLVASEPEIQLFNGISYTQYLRRKARIVKARKQAVTNSMLKRLGSLNFGGGSAEVRQDLDTATGDVQKTTGPLVKKGNSNRLTQRISNQKFTFKATQTKFSGGARKMTEAEKKRLKAKFMALEGKLRRIYAQALRKDPHLNMAISFEAEVKTTGYLSISQFKARGNYQADSLKLFKTKMASLISQVFVAQDLSGTIVRGESMFVR